MLFQSPPSHLVYINTVAPVVDTSTRYELISVVYIGVRYTSTVYSVTPVQKNGHCSRDDVGDEGTYKRKKY